MRQLSAPDARLGSGEFRPLRSQGAARSPSALITAQTSHRRGCWSFLGVKSQQTGGFQKSFIPAGAAEAAGSVTGCGAAPSERRNSAPRQLDAKATRAEREPFDLGTVFPSFYATALRCAAPRRLRHKKSFGSLGLLWKPNILILLFIPVFLKCVLSE